MRLRARQDVERKSQKTVARKNRGRFIEGLVRGGLAAPQVVIVHRWQIVMRQRIAMHAFERDTGHQRLLARHAEEARTLDHQERAEPLARAEACIAHGVEEPGRPGQFIARQGLAEKLIEQAFSVLRDLVEPILELRCRVHIIPTSVAADCLGGLPQFRQSSSTRAARRPKPYLTGPHGPESPWEFRVGIPGLPPSRAREGGNRADVALYISLGKGTRRAMTNDPAALRSGKGHRDENFPVASRLIHPRHRGIILAFYEFVRIADDIADHVTLAPQQKLDLLDRLEASLLGRHDDVPEAVALRRALSERKLPPRHAQDLLTAFRMDVTKLRYRDWDDLMNYCSYSAMPVGRFVLDVHGEDRATWPGNDALCAALQIINHLQDCKKDYRDLDRVYVPGDALSAAGATVEDIGKTASTPALRQCLQGLAARTGKLLEQSAAFSASIRDARLAFEVAVIQSLACRLVAMLRTRDPLSERVHLTRSGVAAVGLVGLFSGARNRLGRVFSAPQAPRNA